MAAVLDVLKRVQAAAEADAAGEPVAHAKLLQEINLLRLAAETPAERLMRMRFHMIENVCIRIAIELGILQAIVAKNGQAVTAADLSKETGTNELLIIRTMRLVTFTGVADEPAYATYASNDTTKLITTRGFIGGEKHHTDLTFAVGAKMVKMIRNKALHQFPEGPDEKSPLQYTYGYTMFELLQHDQEQKEAFDDYMAIRRDPNATQWFEIYPAAKELATGLKTDGNAALVVDVGGGFGHEISKFRQSLSTLPGRLVLQDLPLTFEKIENPEGVEVMPHDFFTEQPVKGARIYYLRNIMHDWSDKNCITIFSKIVKAVDSKYSRILIDDYVLPDTGADRRAAGMDFLMMMFASGMERTKRQWEQLLDQVGLEIVKIWSPETGLECIIETKVRG